MSLAGAMFLQAKVGRTYNGACDFAVLRSDDNILRDAGRKTCN